MQKRICPNCFTRWYSAGYNDEPWIYETCGAEIPVPQEKKIINDIEVNSFDIVDFSILKAPLIAIYDHPSDYPKSYVARVWNCNNPTNIVMLSDDLEKLRRMTPCGMVRMKRSAKDDSCIIETWL